MDRKNEDGLEVEVDLSQIDIRLDDEIDEPVEKKADPAPVGDQNLKANDDAIEALRQQLKSMEIERDAERAEAARKNAELATAAHHASSHAAQRDYDLINTNIANAASRAEQIKRDIRAATESADYERVADLQMEAATLAARKLQYEDQKSTIEDRARQAKAQHSEQVVTRRQSDPLEDAIKDMTAPSKAWLRQHPECVTNPKMNAKVLLGHHEALDQGIKPDTAEYFSFIESHMGYRAKSQRADDSDGRQANSADARPRHSENNHSAPVSRDGNGSSGSQNGSRVRLSRDEVEMAESLDMTPAQYAAWKVKADRDNRYRNN